MTRDLAIISTTLQCKLLIVSFKRGFEGNTAYHLAIIA